MVLEGGGEMSEVAPKRLKNLVYINSSAEKYVISTDLSPSLESSKEVCKHVQLKGIGCFVGWETGEVFCVIPEPEEGK